MNGTVHLACALLMAASVVTVHAQALLPAQTVGLRGASFGDVVLADYDGDGLLDILVTGTEYGAPHPSIRLYRNTGPTSDGRWSFSAVPSVFPDAERYLRGVRASSASAGDFDNDGDVDFLITGASGTVVYRNEGGGVFSAIPIHEEALPGRESSVVDIVTAPSSAWGDYNNNGRLDILLATRTGTYIYRNDGDARFTRVDVGLPPLPNAIVAWGDYDNDGALDILAVSRPFQGMRPTTRVFRNDGGVFVDIGADLPGIEAGSVSWADFDNDGDLDILITSRLPTLAPDGTRRLPTGIYRNDGGVFRHTGEKLPLAWHGTFLDVDGDGNLDILLNGVDGTGTIAQLLRNENGTFSGRSETFDGVWFGAIATGDIDGDGRTDVIMSGRYLAGRTYVPRVIVYRNGQSFRRFPPQTPHSLASRASGETMVLSWLAPAQPSDRTQESYTYNVRVGTTPGGSDVMSATSLATGSRLIPGPGNAGLNRRIHLRGLKPGDRYYWSVQTIDPRDVASPFASEQTFVMGGSGPGSPSDPPVFTDSYPNPFNPSTTIRFSLQHPSQVRVRVFNLLGAEVASLFDSDAGAGVHQAVWDGRDAHGVPVASGTYFYAVETPDQRITRSLLLLK